MTFALSDILNCALSTSPWDRVARVFTLQDYNTRVVVLGTMILGIASGVSGTYMLLRRRALIGDVLSHATLPGIAAAFMVMVAFGGTGKYVPGLLLGGALAGLASVGLVMLIQRLPRIHEDAALGIVLSVSFGIGIALLSLVQQLPTGHQAGLESFLYGKTASMVLGDVRWMAAAGCAAIVLAILLEKEFALLSFDASFARAQGWPTGLIDALMMFMVTSVIVIGLQAVGLILVIAILIIPPAAARFWTERLRPTLFLASIFGGLSGMIGAGISAMAPKLPAGAMIVLVAASIFGLSMVFGLRGGMLPRVVAQRLLLRRVLRQHVLRAIYEFIEANKALDEEPSPVVPLEAIASARIWRPREMQSAVRSARRDDLIDTFPGAATTLRLTKDGLADATRIVRNHRLWEMYLITHADIAPSHVDRDADEIEHVLGPEMIEALEQLLEEGGGVPPSPHIIPATLPGVLSDGLPDRKRGASA